MYPQKVGLLDDSGTAQHSINTLWPLLVRLEARQGMGRGSRGPTDGDPQGLVVMRVAHVVQLAVPVLGFPLALVFLLALLLLLLTIVYGLLYHLGRRLHLLTNFSERFSTPTGRQHESNLGWNIASINSIGNVIAVTAPICPCCL